MSLSKKTTPYSPHFVVAKPATEPEAVICWGEQLLARAHRVAHEIEEHVRQMLDASSNSDGNPSPDRTASASYSGDERIRDEVPVDNRRRVG